MNRKEVLKIFIFFMTRKWRNKTKQREAQVGKIAVLFFLTRKKRKQSYSYNRFFFLFVVARKKKRFTHSFFPFNYCLSDPPNWTFMKKKKINFLKIFKFPKWSLDCSFGYCVFNRTLFCYLFIFFFVFSPCPKDTVIQCEIKTSKSGITNKFYPTYELSLKDNPQVWLAARKRVKNKTSNYYIISLNRNSIDKNDPHSYVGKLR